MIKTHPGRLTLSAVAASLAALSLAACGGSSSGTSAAAAGGTAIGGPASTAAAVTTVHVCALLSAARASAIVGEHYSSAKESLGGSMCSYATTTAPIPLYIIISPGSSGTTAWKEQLGTIEEDSGSAPITLTGVGDRAAGSGTEIGVQDGSYIIDVHGGDPDSTDSNPFPKSIELAKAIIAALR